MRTLEYSLKSGEHQSAQSEHSAAELIRVRGLALTRLIQAFSHSTNKALTMNEVSYEVAIAIIEAHDDNEVLRIWGTHLTSLIIKEVRESVLH